MLSETVLILVNFCTKNMRIGELTFAKSTFCQHLLHSFYSYNLEFLSIWPNVIQHFLSSLSNRNKINRCILQPNYYKREKMGPPSGFQLAKNVFF
jgi:hypothetical protein